MGVTVEQRRRYIRKSLSSIVSVFERINYHYVGLLADYSEEGLMVTSSVRSVEVGRQYQYMLLIPSPGKGSSIRVAIDAECVWCEQTSPSFYGVGYRLHDLSDEARAALACCIDRSIEGTLLTVDKIPGV